MAAVAPSTPLFAPAAPGAMVSIEDDTATGGPDLTRGIYPVVVSITGAEGAVRHLDEEIGAVVREVVAARTENPGA